ncbi:MAG: hypothetical protein ACYC92_00830 [Candidatus Acidiferrales bacterium]
MTIRLRQELAAWVVVRQVPALAESGSPLVERHLESLRSVSPLLGRSWELGWHRKGIV